MHKENNLQKMLTERLLHPTAKGLGDVSSQPQITTTAQLGWNLLQEDVSLPVAVLSSSRVQHNLNWMNSFIRTYGLKLAPHGKTTMSPALFHQQLAHGAWGITLATAPQVQAAYHFGVRGMAKSPSRILPPFKSTEAVAPDGLATRMRIV